MGSSSRHSRWVLRRHALGSAHPHPSWVSHPHLLTLTLLMVRMRRHQACSSLSLQGHLPLSVGHLLDLHGDFYSGWWRAGRGLLLGDGGLALLLIGWLLAANTTSHDSATWLLLWGRGRTEDRFALGLMHWG